MSRRTVLSSSEREGLFSLPDNQKDLIQQIKERGKFLVYINVSIRIQLDYRGKTSNVRNRHLQNIQRKRALC